MSELFIHDPDDVAYGLAMLQGKLPCLDNTITLFVSETRLSQISMRTNDLWQISEWAEAIIGEQGNQAIEQYIAPAIGALQVNEYIVGLSLYNNPGITEEGLIALDRAAVLTKAPLSMWNNQPLDRSMTRARAAHRPESGSMHSARSSMDDTIASSVTVSSVLQHIDEIAEGDEECEQEGAVDAISKDDSASAGPSKHTIECKSGSCASIEEKADEPAVPGHATETSVQKVEPLCVAEGTDEEQGEDDETTDGTMSPPTEMLEQEWEQLEQKEKRLLERKRRLEVFRIEKERNARQEFAQVLDRLKSLSNNETELEAEWLRKEVAYNKEKTKLEAIKQEFETCLTKVLKKQDRLDFARERLEETRHEIDHLKERKMELEELLQKLKGIIPGPEAPPCPICYCSMEKKQALQCGHVFCPDCVNRLRSEPFAEQRVCAICRTIIAVVVTLYD